MTQIDVTSKEPSPIPSPLKQQPSVERSKEPSPIPSPLKQQPSVENQIKMISEQDGERNKENLENITYPPAQNRDNNERSKPNSPLSDLSQPSMVDDSSLYAFEEVTLSIIPENLSHRGLPILFQSETNLQNSLRTQGQTVQNNSGTKHNLSPTRKNKKKNNNKINYSKQDVGGRRNVPYTKPK